MRGLFETSGIVAFRGFRTLRHFLWFPVGILCRTFLPVLSFASLGEFQLSSVGKFANVLIDGGSTSAEDRADVFDAPARIILQKDLDSSADVLPTKRSWVR